MLHFLKELNDGRLFNPRFRRPRRISGSCSTTRNVTCGIIVSGEKFSGICFVIFGRMISIYNTKKMEIKDFLWSL